MGDPRTDNHANQMNPNNETFWQSRGWEERPENWEEVLEVPDDNKPTTGKPASQATK